MEISANSGRLEDIDRYYGLYQRALTSQVSVPMLVPGQVNYLYGKSLFLARNDAAAKKVFLLVSPSDPYFLRTQYLLGAVAVRAGDDQEALRIFEEIVRQTPQASEDDEVQQMAHLARGRLYYELDQLVKSVDAYQEIPYDSPFLTTMLYEVTWTHVRRGQLAARGEPNDNLTEEERRENARAEYERALSQLSDLRALNPMSELTGEIDILAGNLRLQQGEFDEAYAMFNGVRTEYGAAEANLAALMANRSSREKLLQDVLLASQGELTSESLLPPLAAQRASGNEDVAKAVQVFRSLSTADDDIDDAQEKLLSLEELLSLSNVSRSEMFRPLQPYIERSTALANAVFTLQAQTLAYERSLVNLNDSSSELATLAAFRSELERKIALLPRTSGEIASRKQDTLKRWQQIDHALHQVELAVHTRRAELNAIDFMFSRGEKERESRANLDLRRNQLRDARRDIKKLEDRAADLRRGIEQLRAEIEVLGGKNSADEVLRNRYAQLYEEERKILYSLRGTDAAPFAGVDALHALLGSLHARNGAFRSQLDQSVQQRLAGAFLLLRAVRGELGASASLVATVDRDIQTVRDRATETALQRVREDLSQVILRADVGVVDTAFARKQAETEELGRLRRSKASELTDITRAYTDLTKDGFQ